MKIYSKIIIGENMKVISYDSILEQITKRNRIPRVIALIIGTFIIALIYNAFIVPNNIVYGGLGGIAIIVNNFTGLNTTIFYNVVTVILTAISVIILGYKKTSYTIVGFLSYTLMVNITAPLVSFFQLEFASNLFSIMFYAVIDGIGMGLLYKAGFDTGGSDTIIAIAQKYFKFPKSQLSNLINGIIVLAGAATFGIVKSIYAIIYLGIINFISDRTILGSSTSKICFIKSSKVSEVEELLTNDLEIGYTLIDSTNGIGILKKVVIMCVIPTDRFYDFKKELMLIDKKIEIISNDCYTVIGGKINKIINV